MRIGKGERKGSKKGWTEGACPTNEKIVPMPGLQIYVEMWMKTTNQSRTKSTRWPQVCQKNLKDFLKDIQVHFQELFQWCCTAMWAHQKLLHKLCITNCNYKTETKVMHQPNSVPTLKQPIDMSPLIWELLQNYRSRNAIPRYEGTNESVNQITNHFLWHAN